VREDGRNVEAPYKNPTLYQQQDKRTGRSFHAPGHLTSIK
jgi:hypothetical protein